MHVPHLSNWPFLWLHLSICLFATPLFAAETARPEPKPVPRMQAVPQPDHQISFQRDGVEIARYHFGPTLNRPFVFPLIGPAGRSVTRLGHPRDPEGHSHHNSFWISHNDVNGVNFWGDTGTNVGRIVHQQIQQLADGPEAAAIQTVNAWTDKTGKVLLSERRRTTVQWLPNNEWLLILDLQLEAKGEAVTLGKSAFGMVAVRVAKTMGVNDGGGTIRNSAGGVNEQEVFWKPAKWMDYSGPITATATEGVTLFDHPANPNHPSVFHVHDDGWMGASLTFTGPRVIEPGQSLQLRYGLYVHAGKPAVEQLQKRWEDFSREPVFEFKAKSK